MNAQNQSLPIRNQESINIFNNLPDAISRVKAYACAETKKLRSISNLAGAGIRVPASRHEKTRAEARVSQSPNCPGRSGADGGPERLVPPEHPLVAVMGEWCR